MKTISVLVVLAFGANLASGQASSDVHQRTSSPPNARFEIVQSEIAAKWTFRLDRYTCHVSQLVKTKDDGNSWESMRVLALPLPGPQAHAHFQIFASGIAAKFTFLIDTDTGRSWTLATSKAKQDDGTEYDENLWEPFED